jgi:hypothetical protein
MTKRKIILFQGLEVHVALHVKGVNGPGCTALEASHLRDDIIIQVLRITGESENEGLLE